MSIMTRQEFANIVNKMQGSVDTLRLQMTYLAFDLEATRRENQQLKDRLEKYGETF